MAMDAINFLVFSKQVCASLSLSSQLAANQFQWIFSTFFNPCLGLVAGQHVRSHKAGSSFGTECCVTALQPAPDG
jgi:hypothetical protein